MARRFSSVCEIKQDITNFVEGSFPTYPQIDVLRVRNLFFLFSRIFFFFFSFLPFVNMGAYVRETFLNDVTSRRNFY